MLPVRGAGASGAIGSGPELTENLDVKAGDNPLSLKQDEKPDLGHDKFGQAR